MAHLINIGNSKGIRIPKALIEQSQLEGAELELKVTTSGLLIHPIQRKAREGWKEQFNKAGNAATSPVDFTSNTFDTEDWKWPGL
jgi:antitoxin MazE